MRRWESAENHFKYIIFMSHLWIFPLFLLFASFSIQCSSGCGLPFRQFLTEQRAVLSRLFPWDLLAKYLSSEWKMLMGLPRTEPQQRQKKKSLKLETMKQFFSTSYILAFRLHFFVLYYSRILDLSLSIRRRATHFSRLLLSTYNLSHPVPTVEINVNKLRRERENNVLPELFSGLCRRDNLSRSGEHELDNWPMVWCRGSVTISFCCWTLRYAASSTSSRPFHRPNIHTASLRLRKKRKWIIQSNCQFRLILFAFLTDSSLVRFDFY